MKRFILYGFYKASYNQTKMETIVSIQLLPNLHLRKSKRIITQPLVQSTLKKSSAHVSLKINV